MTRNKQYPQLTPVGVLPNDKARARAVILAGVRDIARKMARADHDSETAHHDQTRGNLRTVQLRPAE